MKALNVSWAFLKHKFKPGETITNPMALLDMPIECSTEGCKENGWWSKPLEGYYCKQHEREALEPVKIPSIEPWLLDEDENYTEPYEYNPE